MDNYKGIYYGQTTETKSFEGGAHFRYKDLYHALLSLYNSLSQDKVGTALHYYASTTELKPTRTRNAFVSFNNLPVNHLKTEDDTNTTNKEVVPIINVKHTTSSSNNILNAHNNNNNNTRNKNLLIQANPNTKITGGGGSGKVQRNVIKHDCVYINSNSNSNTESNNVNVHQRKKSACVVNNNNNNDNSNTYIKYTKHNNTNNNSDNLNNVIYKVKKKTPLILTTEGNNNTTTTESHQHIITSSNNNNNYVLNKRLIKPKIKSIKYQLHHAPFVNIVPNEFCKNNSLYSILKKQEQTDTNTDNTATTHNRNSFQLNIKKQLNYKFKNNYSLSKSNNKSNIINISNHNTESTTNTNTNNNNAVSIQTYFYKDKKSRNERNNKQNIMFPSSSKCFHTSTTYNQRMLRDMYQSHIQNMRKQMITNHSQSKSKEKRNTTNNNTNHSSSAIKYFHNHSLTHLKHVNKANPQQQSIAHYSLYQRSAIDLGNRSKLHSNHTHQGSYFKYRKSNVQKLLGTTKK